MSTYFIYKINKISNRKYEIDIENIEIQNDNILILNYPQKGDQLLNLSFQMLNVGIQTFNIEEKFMIMNSNSIKFYMQFKEIIEK